MASYVNTNSTIKLQQEVNDAKAFPDLNPVLNVAGSSAQPALRAANDVMNAIAAVPFDLKFFEVELPVFYTNSYQQDYALINPDGSSVLNLSWLVRGVAIDINNNSNPKPSMPVEVGRQLPEVTGNFYTLAFGTDLILANFFPNNLLYYGTWGAVNVGGGDLGNNPMAGSTYTNPLGAQSQPANPIAQIQDANGNFLILTTYGSEGTTAPVAPANSVAGTTCQGLGATTVWTVLDPFGQGIRILPVPSQTGVAWQINLTGQLKPMRFTSLGQTLYPLPDEYEPHFFQGFVAQLYRYSPEAKIRQKFEQEWQLWLRSLESLRVKSDREQEENMFVPDRGITSYNRRMTTFAGPFWPFNYPR